MNIIKALAIFFLAELIFGFIFVIWSFRSNGVEPQVVVSTTVPTPGPMVCDDIRQALDILDYGKGTHLQWLNITRSSTFEDFTPEQIAKWEAADSWNWKWVKNYRFVISIMGNYKKESGCP